VKTWKETISVRVWVWMCEAGRQKRTETQQSRPRAAPTRPRVQPGQGDGSLQAPARSERGSTRTSETPGGLLQKRQA